MFVLEETILKKPSIEFKDTFLEWLSEAHAENTYIFWDNNTVKNDFQRFVESQLSKEIMCPIGNVPESVYWIINNNVMLGRISIRHQLTDKLREKGGNIGYQISKSYRGKGFATKALELALVEAKKIGLNEALLTTDRNNYASQRVILKNSGELISDLNKLNDHELLKYLISINHIN